MRDAACDAFFFTHLLACLPLTALQEFVASHVKDELQLAALKKVPALRWRKQDKSEKEKGGGKKDKEGGGKGEGKGEGEGKAAEGESASAFR